MIPRSGGALEAISLLRSVFFRHVSSLQSQEAMFLKAAWNIVHDAFMHYRAHPAYELLRNCGDHTAVRLPENLKLAWWSRRSSCG